MTNPNEPNPNAIWRNDISCINHATQGGAKIAEGCNISHSRNKTWDTPSSKSTTINSLPIFVFFSHFLQPWIWVLQWQTWTPASHFNLRTLWCPPHLSNCPVFSPETPSKSEATPEIWNSQYNFVSRKNKLLITRIAASSTLSMQMHVSPRTILVRVRVFLRTWHQTMFKKWKIMAMKQLNLVRQERVERVTLWPGWEVGWYRGRWPIFLGYHCPRVGVWLGVVGRRGQGRKSSTCLRECLEGIVAL